MKPKAKPERDWYLHAGFELRRQFDNGRLIWNVYKEGKFLGTTGKIDIMGAMRHVDANKDNYKPITVRDLKEERVKCI